MSSARTDAIFIEGLECRARVGVPEWERRKRQKIVLDLELTADLRRAGRSDQVRDTVDYAAVAREVRELVGARPFRLVEAVAESAAQHVLARFPVKRVRIRARKFSVPGSESVGVEIVRPSARSGRTG